MVRLLSPASEMERRCAYDSPRVRTDLNRQPGPAGAADQAFVAKGRGVGGHRQCAPVEHVGCARLAEPKPERIMADAPRWQAHRAAKGLLE